MNNISLFSFFSGSGFLDLGFEDSGFEIVFVNEYHKPFMDAYKFSRNKLMYKNHIYEYSNLDIEEYLSPGNHNILKNYILNEQKRGRLIGFIGGPPCPDFSVGGKNKGKNGDNGRLTGTYFKLVCCQKPDFVIFENVKGLWRTKKHRAFYEEVKANLAEADYITTENLVNAIEFGVPQDRERIILFAIKKEILADKKNLDHFNWDKNKIYNREKIFSYPWPTTNKFKEKLIRPNNIPIELTVDYWFKKNNVSGHPNTNDQFKPKAGLAKFKLIDEGDVSKKSYKRLHRFRYSPTSAYGNNEVHLHPTEARRINVAEALSIQSMPREFILPESMSLTNKFKTIGNGVPYLLSKGIAGSIRDFLKTMGS